MNEDLRTRETLSAWMDDEANELEIQRLLKQPVSQDALATLRRYQSARAVLSGHRHVASVDVSAGVAAALRDEIAHHQPDISSAPVGEQSKKGRWQLLGGAAVAASVAFGVMFSAQLVRETPSENPPQFAQAPVVPSQSPLLRQPLVQGQPVDFNSSRTTPPAEPSTERVASEESQRRLNEYLMRHAEHAALSNGQSMVPFARMVGHESQQQPPQR